MSGTILPGNFSDLERDLDVALSRIEQVEIPIAVLWDPWQCPAEVLPYLAWALSVDVWRTDWPEKVKRRVVANSLAVIASRAPVPRLNWRCGIWAFRRTLSSGSRRCPRLAAAPSS